MPDQLTQTVGSIKLELRDIIAELSGPNPDIQNISAKLRDLAMMLSNPEAKDIIFARK